MNDLAVVDLESGEIVERVDSLPQIFKPEQTLIELKILEVGMKLAAEIGDKQGMEIAAEKIIHKQGQFVSWWAGNVRGKGKRRNVADPSHFVSEAQAKTSTSIVALA